MPAWPLSLSIVARLSAPMLFVRTLILPLRSGAHEYIQYSAKAQGKCDRCASETGKTKVSLGFTFTQLRKSLIPVFGIIPYHAFSYCINITLFTTTLLD